MDYMYKEVGGWEGDGMGGGVGWGGWAAGGGLRLPTGLFEGGSMCPRSASHKPRQARMI